MSIKTFDIIKIIENVAPLKLSQSWDNCGLQVGSKFKKIEKIYLALDPTLNVVLDAKKKGADIIITHHPLIFQSLKNIDIDTYIGKILSLCIKENISVFSHHTNFDTAKGCLNDLFAQKIGLENTRVLSPIIDSDEELGLGRVGFLKKPTKFKLFIPKIKKALNLKTVRVVGDLNKTIKEVAINTGSGSSFVKEFLKTSADLYISGDIRYHEALNIEEANLSCIDAGHFATECFFSDLMYDILKKANLKVEIIKSTIEKEPFWYI